MGLIKIKDTEEMLSRNPELWSRYIILYVCGGSVRIPRRYISRVLNSAISSRSSPGTGEFLTAQDREAELNIKLVKELAITVIAITNPPPQLLSL
jgi:hypothetical protein